MGKKPTLTEKQRKFAYELVTNEGRITGTEAAKRAGYGSPRERAYELQNPRKFPLVVNTLEKLEMNFKKNMTLHFKDIYLNLQK